MRRAQAGPARGQPARGREAIRAVRGAVADAPARDRRGFTLVELLLVVVIISIVAALAQPNLQKALLKAKAASIVAELNVVKVAVLTYHGDRHSWPPDRNRGIIPPGLAPYLPEGFSFVRREFTVDYDNWSGKAKPAFKVGLTVITTDQALGLAVLDMLGNNVFRAGTKFHWVIEW